MELACPACFANMNVHNLSVWIQSQFTQRYKRLTREHFPPKHNQLHKRSCLHFTSIQQAHAFGYNSCGCDCVSCVSPVWNLLFSIYVSNSFSWLRLEIILCNTFWICYKSQHVKFIAWLTMNLYSDVYHIHHSVRNILRPWCVQKRWRTHECNDLF